jgi:magnesium-transporting ATPase (P-type)
MLHDVCVGKTGTLTKGKMTVTSFHYVGVGQQEMVEKIDAEEYINFFTKYQMDSNLKSLIKEAILCNTDVRIEVNDATCTYEPMGQALEVGMIKFLVDNIPLIDKKGREGKE